MHFHAEVRHIGEFHGVVRLGEDRFTQVVADLRRIDVECSAELNVAHVIAAEADVHKTWDEIVLFGAAIKLDALDEGRRAIADSNDGDADFVFHDVVAPSKFSTPERTLLISSSSSAARCAAVCSARTRLRARSPICRASSGDILRKISITSREFFTIRTSSPGVKNSSSPGHESLMIGLP